MSTLRHPDWHWVARQVFRKRALVRVSYQWFDSTPHVVLSDAVMGAHVRLSAAAEQFWQAIDGETSIQHIWDRLRAQQARPPTQDDLVSWVVQLVQQGLLLSDHPLDSEALSRRHEKRSHTQIEQRFASPLAVKTRLFDPHALTMLLWPWVSWLFSRTGGFVFLMLLLAGLMSGVLVAPQFLASADDMLLSQTGVLLLLICYPLMKFIHEFAHCWMVYRFGGQVREFGIMWLVLFPVPYVEASDASAFADKRARMLVGAAGILAEIGMAAIAMLIWPWMEPGIARAMLYQVIVIGTVSTLLFNGNPLLKFDAYFVLADYLEIPNLAKRSADYVREGVFRWVAGVRPSQRHTRREAFIFRIYGPLSLSYRVVLTLTIAWLAMSWFYVVGLILAIWAVSTGILWPLVKSIGTGFKQAKHQHQLKRALGRSLLVGGLIMGFGLGWPLPFIASGQGPWVATESYQIIAEGSGPVDQILQFNGARVEKAEALVQLKDLELDGRARALDISREFLRDTLSRGGLSANERLQLAEQLALLEQTAGDFEIRLEALTVRSPQTGTLRWQGGLAPHVGTFVARGDVLGSIVAPDGMELILAFPAHFSGVAAQNSALEGRLMDGRTVDLRVTRTRVVDVGGALPPAVTRARGGTVAEDPSQPSTALEPVWLVWAETEADVTEYLGTQVDARWVLGEKTLFSQWAFHLRQLFVRALRV